MGSVEYFWRIRQGHWTEKFGRKKCKRLGRRHQRSEGDVLLMRLKSGKSLLWVVCQALSERLLETYVVVADREVWLNRVNLISPICLEALSEKGSVSVCRSKSGQHQVNQALGHSDTLWASILWRYPVSTGQCHSRACVHQSLTSVALGGPASSTGWEEPPYTWSPPRIGGLATSSGWPPLRIWNKILPCACQKGSVPWNHSMHKNRLGVGKYSGKGIKGVVKDWSAILMWLGCAWLVV